MRRREFVTLLGGIATVWPFAASAQQPPRLPTVGFLNIAALDDYGRRIIAAFREGLSDAGYVEGRNVALTFRFAEYHVDRLPAMALDLVRQGVDVIFASGFSVPASLAATNTIPIVFTASDDPVASGYVESLGRPGGNVTGVTFLADSLNAKRIELLHEIDPKAASVAVLVGPVVAALPMQRARIESEIEGAAKSFGLSVRYVSINGDDDIIPAFKDITARRDDAIHIMTDVFLGAARARKLAELAVQAGLPMTSPSRDFGAGALLSYGASGAANYRIAGTYVGRILNGEKPAELPVQESTKVELVINLKTAKALGLTVPLSLLGRADEVIE